MSGIIVVSLVRFVKVSWTCPLCWILWLETEDDQTSAQLEELREMVNSVLKRFKKEVETLTTL